MVFFGQLRCGPIRSEAGAGEREAFLRRGESCRVGRVLRLEMSHKEEPYVRQTETEYGHDQDAGHNGHADASIMVAQTMGYGRHPNNHLVPAPWRWTC